MSSLPWAAFVFVLYAVPATLVCLPVVWWNRSIGWRWWELVFPVVPFGLWFCLTAPSDRGKSLSNAVIEPLLCGCAACIPFLLRAAAGRFGWSAEVGNFIGLCVSCISY